MILTMMLILINKHIDTKKNNNDGQQTKNDNGSRSYNNNDARSDNDTTNNAITIRMMMETIRIQTIKKDTIFPRYTTAPRRVRLASE